MLCPYKGTGQRLCVTSAWDALKRAPTKGYKTGRDGHSMLCPYKGTGQWLCVTVKTFLGVASRKYPA